ncbi:MAG: TIGR01212 family radical SAM protein [Desulfomonile sp.]
MSSTGLRYRSLSSWLKEIFGEPVRKINIDAGLGCPNRNAGLGKSGCIYCNPRGSGTGASGISISQQVDRGVSFLSRRYRCNKFIGYFQSYTNTYGDPDQLAGLYGEALQRSEIVGLAIGTRPDCVPDSILNLLAELSKDRLVWIEYGLQSIHSETLNLIRRGHGPDEFFDAVKRTLVRGIPTVVHLILGLPGESSIHMTETAKAVAVAGVQGVKLHPLYVIRGTYLEQMYTAGEYLPLTQEQAAQAVLDVLKVLPPDMVIHRMTSDPHPEELVAPLWMLNRAQVRRHLEQTMIMADFRQGADYASGAQGSIRNGSEVRQRKYES